MTSSTIVSATPKPKTKHSILPAAVTFVLITALWEAAVRGFGVPLYLLPPPSGILDAFLQQPGYLLQIGLFTFGEALAGFAIGCGLGALVAAVCVRFPLLADGLMPFSVAS